MCAITELEDEHCRLMVLAGELWRQLQSDNPPPLVPLFEVRAKLASVLLHHLKMEDWVIYPNLTRSQDSDTRNTALRLQEQMGSLADAFRIHAESWTTFAIARDWAAYKLEATTLLESLERRIKLEEEELYPLVKDPSVH